MDHNVLSEDGRVKFACYQCGNGYVHLEYANLALTFTEDQFLNFSECIAAMREHVVEQREARETAAVAQAFQSYVM